MTKRDYLQAIVEAAKGIRTPMMMRELLVVAELYRQRSGNEPLADADWNRISIIRAVMDCGDERAIRRIKAFASVSCERARKRKEDAE